jgi:hypothetical protein
LKDSRTPSRVRPDSQKISLLQYFKTVLDFKTKFSRKTFISFEDKVIQTDCSGVFNYFFHSYNIEKYDDLLNHFQTNRLHACDYYNLFKKNGRFDEKLSWDKINDVRDIIAGDLFVWSKVNIPKGGDTGHMGIFLEPLKEIEQGLFSGLVADVSKLAHDNDSREEGIGSGRMFFKVNEDFGLTGYIWSTQRKKNKLTNINIVRFIED